MVSEYEELLSRGMLAAEEGDNLHALHLLEQIPVTERTAMVNTYIGLCVSRERREIKKGANLCLEGMREEPGNALHYLNLGRIYLLAGQRTRAISIFRKGLKLGRNDLIIGELKSLGLRKAPVFSALARDNPLNKYAGLIATRLGLR